MKKLLVLLFSLFFLSSPSVFAEDTNLSGYLMCGTFLDACDKSKLNIDCQTQTFWTLGYISSKTYSQNIKISQNVFDAKPVKYALIKYCKANPFSDTHEAAEDIFNQIN